MLRDFEQVARLALSSVRASLEAGPPAMSPNLKLFVAVDVVVTGTASHGAQKTEEKP